MSANPPAQPKLECICGTLGVIGQRATFCYSPMARNWRRAGDHQSSGASVSAVFSSNTTGGPHEFLDLRESAIPYGQNTRMRKGTRFSMLETEDELNAISLCDRLACQAADSPRHDTPPVQNLNVICLNGLLK
jgi:hypothetical protein